MQVCNTNFLFDEHYLLEREVDQFQNNEKQKYNNGEGNDFESGHVIIMVNEDNLQCIGLRGWILAKEI